MCVAIKFSLDSKIVRKTSSIFENELTSVDSVIKSYFMLKMVIHNS